MDQTTQREYDDELAQQAPLVPFLDRARRSDEQTAQREYDDELAQEAPLVPFLDRDARSGGSSDVRSELAELRDQLDRIEGAMETRSR
ncbi:MAG: hypothetical protein ABEJ82_08780 [Haloplanus sp.]